MRIQDWRLWLGILLVGLGILLLLENLNILVLRLEIMWPILFAAGGLAFLAVFFNNRDNWWALIPSFTLVGLALVTGLPLLFPQSTGSWLGGMFLAALGLSFWAIYLNRTENWWAIIPGGVLITMALVASLNEVFGESLGGTVFLLGLVVTFGLVYLLPTPGQRMKWALIPALVLLGLAIVTAAAVEGILGYLWPLLLIGAGLLIIWRRRRET